MIKPYSNGQLPNLTVRTDTLKLIQNLPVQVDHLKRSGIGKVVMGLLNCREVGERQSALWGCQRCVGLIFLSARALHLLSLLLLYLLRVLCLVLCIGLNVPSLRVDSA